MRRFNQLSFGGMIEKPDGKYCLFDEAEQQVSELVEALRFFVAHCENNKQIAGVVSLAKEALDHAERKAGE
jgi:hypothetical protein